jgi:hypothetical protein
MISTPNLDFIVTLKTVGVYGRRAFRSWVAGSKVGVTEDISKHQRGKERPPKYHLAGDEVSDLSHSWLALPLQFQSR